VIFVRRQRPGRIVIDAAGAVWIVNQTAIAKLSNSGTFLSGQNGFSGGLTAPSSIVVDDGGNAWVTDPSASGRVVEYSNSGTVLSGGSGYGAGQGVPRQIAIAVVTQKSNSRRRRNSKQVHLRLPDLEHAKAAVLNSLNALDAKRLSSHHR
jgi:DNA-binding beta-propeller fold protein YncE